MFVFFVAICDDNLWIKNNIENVKFHLFDFENNISVFWLKYYKTLCNNMNKPLDFYLSTQEKLFVFVLFSLNYQA